MNILLILLSLFASDGIFDFNFASNTNQEVAIGTKEYSYVKINADIYCTNRQITTNSIFTLNKLEDISSDKIELKIPKLKLNYPLGMYTIRNLAFGEGKLALILSDYVIIYNEVDSFSTCTWFNLKNIFPDREYAGVSRNMYLEDNKIFGMYDIYDAIEKEEEDYHFWCLNLENIENSKYLSFPPPKAFFYTIFQPRSIIDYSEGKILTSEILKYKLYLRNMNGNIQDSIIREIPDWVSSNLHKDSKDKNWRNYVQKIQSDTTKVSLIHRADFLTKDKILVTYSMENRRKEGDISVYDLYYDVWKNIDGVWELVKKDVSMNSLQQKDYSKSNLFFSMDYKILDGHLISTHFNRETYSDYKIIVRDIK